MFPVTFLQSKLPLEHDNANSVSIKCLDILEQLGDWWLLKDSGAGSWLVIFRIRIRISLADLDGIEKGEDSTCFPFQCPFIVRNKNNLEI
jgi:hypothetical protein